MVEDDLDVLVLKHWDAIAERAPMSSSVPGELVMPQAPGTVEFPGENVEAVVWQTSHPSVQFVATTSSHRAAAWAMLRQMDRPPSYVSFVMDAMIVQDFIASQDVRYFIAWIQSGPAAHPLLTGKEWELVYAWNRQLWQVANFRARRPELVAIAAEMERSVGRLGPLGEQLADGMMEGYAFSLDKLRVATSWDPRSGDGLVTCPMYGVPIDTQRATVARESRLSLPVVNVGARMKSNRAPGYQSWSWTQQDWRVVVPKKNDVDFDSKCGSAKNRTADGKTRLCLPVFVIEELRKTKEGKRILVNQARKKERAKPGDRVPWHPRIKELHRQLEEMTEPDDPSKG